MTDPPPETDPHGDALAARASALAGHVADLTAEVSELNRRADRSRRVVAWTIAGLVVDVAMSILVVFGLVGQTATDRRLEASIARQEEIRNGALCPLYNLITESENPRARDVYPKGPAAYDEAFRMMRAARTTLDC